MAIDRNGKELRNHAVTKYNNQLNKLIARKFTTTESNIFWAVVTQLVETKKDSVIFSYKEIADTIGYTGHKAKLTDILEQMSKDLLSLKVMNEQFDENGTLISFESFVAFSYFHGNYKKKTLTVDVERHFMPYINDLGKNYTRFLLSQLTSLETKYSKNLFRLLKQYHTTGKFKCGKAQLYALLGIPKSYYGNFKLVEERIFNPAINELEGKGYFKNIKYKKNTATGTHGGKPQITGFIFTFKPQKGTRDLNARRNVPNGKFRKVQAQKATRNMQKALAEGDMQKFMKWQDELSKVLDLEKVTITDPEGKDITNDDLKLDKNTEKFTWTPTITKKKKGLKAEALKGLEDILGGESEEND